MTTTLLWFRSDLRLADNPALSAALDSGSRTIIPVYIQDDATTAGMPPQAREGGASRWWLHHSLTALDGSLRQLGSRLIVRRGSVAETLKRLIEETGATAVHWNRDLTPHGIERDRAIKQDLQDGGISARSFNAALLHEPWQILNRQDQPYRVFTAYWRALLVAGLDHPVLPPPSALPPVPADLAGDTIQALGLLPDIPRTGDWASAFPHHWQPGEVGAWSRLEGFLDQMADYAERRNLMAIDGTSGLSPHLHFGEIGPRQIIARLRGHRPDLLEHRGSEHFVRELGWREFAHYLLYHFPHTVERPLIERFDRFQWRDHHGEARADLIAWQRGQTGVPVVDAAMRCLWRTGWMHNRARMIVASFLTKNLLIDWRAGAAWFMDTLVDADLASNTAGWQWVAGSGADAAPYFRIFNPVLQTKKFDPDGQFIRRWLPELGRLSGKTLFAPWDSRPETLASAGVELGEDYPEPIVDISASRQRALDRFAEIRTEDNP